MKSRQFIFGVLMVLAIGLFVWSARNYTATSVAPIPETNAPPLSGGRAAAEPPRRGDALPPGRGAQAPILGGTQGMVSPSVTTKEEQMRDGLAKLNDEEVVLYGRVLDQFGTPVAAAN